MEKEVLLEVRNISKEFPGVKALQGISFSIPRGEVRALCGENGAGKSTLIKILTGIYSKDGGEILFKGSPVHFAGSSDARAAGISTVYQELNLIPYLSVAENIFIGSYPKDRTGIDWKRVNEEAAALLKSLKLHIDEKAILNTLGAASQQMVAIARALRDKNCDLLILDEPTSSLDSGEVEMFFSFLRELKKRGVTMIFITHRLEEIYQICDSITVLKDGKLVGTWPCSELDRKRLVACMVGHEVTQNEAEVKHAVIDRSGKTPVLRVKGLKSLPVVKNVSFEVFPGEIVGLAGLLGSGRTETARAIYGCDKADAGTIEINGKEVKIKSPADALRHKMAFCTENRRYDGIVPEMDVKNNAVLNSLKELSRFGLISSRKRNQKVRYYIDRFRIKTPGLGQQIKFLSGGNQQKVLLSRALACSPQFIILDEPTRGIDVGAKAEIEELMREVANEGIGILFISSELTEVVHNSDRVVVIKDGTTVGELEGDSISVRNITDMIAGAAVEGGE